MKIGMILDEVFPPDPRVENEAITLANSGHDVFLFCLTYGNQLLNESTNGIQIRRYKSNKLIHKLSALSCDFFAYKMIMKPKIDHFIKKNSIEVLHIHDIRIAEAVFLSNKKFQLKVVLDLHDNIPENMKFYPHLNHFPGKHMISPNKWKTKEKEFIKQSNKIITVSPNFAKQVIDSNNLEREKMVLVPNTVRASFFKDYFYSLEIKNKYLDKYVLLYLGDTHVRRGLLTAIRASKTLSKTIPNFKLVIVGRNTTDTILIQEVKRLNLEPYVDFEGWKDVSLFPSYILSSNVCISPLNRSIQHDIAYANKIFQYMSFAKPILVSNATAQKELVERVSSGLVHEEKNEEDFCCKVIELYQNNDKAEKLGKNGKEFIENEFSWEITSKALVKLYDEL
ncbi:glycosyltransferase family 4 protein [Flavobacteriaceae bacterium]|nr:glycosyltransferase family 4 protein [Flavobacteriaceae bacterium]